jgi:hypothetical protein
MTELERLREENEKLRKRILFLEKQLKVDDYITKAMCKDGTCF